MSILDCSIISPLGNSAAFSSTSSSPEKNANFRTSVSVSSLTEIFEKSGDFGSETENSGLSASAKSDTTAVQNAKNMDASVQTSAAGEKVQSCSEGGSEMEAEALITKAVEERVAYFVEKISQISVSGATSKDTQSSSDPREAGDDSQSEHDAKCNEIVKRISLKDLEHSFVTALNMASCNEKTSEKTADNLPVPSIQITEASDREDSSSDEPGETSSKSEANETKAEENDVTQMGESDKEPTDDNSKAIPSTSTASQNVKDESEVSQEERRHFFYISSSDLPASELSDSGLRQRSVDAERAEYSGTNPVLTDNTESASSSCLCSKSVHGAVFLTSFIIALAGFILYNFANQGKIPDFCRHLGLVTAVLAGTVGAFSCFCYSLLEAFPAIPARYDRMRESRKFRSNMGNKSNLDEESWSSEKERAFRRQNGMSSNRTSAGSITNDQSEYLLIRQSDHRELVDKTEKLKKEVAGLLDSVSDVMTKIQQVDVVGEMECGLMNNESSK